MSTEPRNKKPRTDDHEAEEIEEEKTDGDKDVANKALLNADILEIVFKHLDFFRLKLCRTVCKTWNEEICRRLRNRSVTHVQTLEEYENFTSTLTSGRALELPQLMHSLSVYFVDSVMLSQVLLLPVPLPITRLHINEEMDCQPSATTKDLLTLLIQCSSTLMSLKIPFCSIFGAPESGYKCPEIFEFPLLEELQITVFERNLFPDPEEVPQPTEACYLQRVNQEKVDGANSFFSKLTQSAPKLTRQEFVFHSDSHFGLVGAAKLEKMTSLKIWTTASLEGTCRVLRKVKFQNLKTLSLHSQSGPVVPFTALQPILHANCGSLESLSLDTYDRSLYNLDLLCPAVKSFTIRHFSALSWDLSWCFPNLTTVRIHNVSPTLTRTLQTCPESIKRVEIGFGQHLPEVKESLWSLYAFFTPCATAWDLPYEYVEDFCDFIGSEREGRGVKSLTIGFQPQRRCEIYWSTLRQGLERTDDLLDLKELTIGRCGSGFNSSIWNSLNPQIFHKLRKFVYFSSLGFTELPDLASKLKLMRRVELLGNRPVRFDAALEQVFSTLPNATVRHGGGQGIVERKCQGDSEEIVD